MRWDQATRGYGSHPGYLITLAGLGATVGAVTQKFQAMPDNAKIIAPQEKLIDAIQWFQGGIIDPTATQTAQVIVMVGGGVVPSLGPGGLQLQNLSGFRKNIQIPVNSTQTNPGQSLPHHFIDFQRCRVTFHLAELFHDDLSLAAQPKFLIVTLHNNNSYYVYLNKTFPAICQGRAEKYFWPTRPAISKKFIRP